MLKLRLEQFDPPLREILCLGAHCDDLEIGCGGAVLKLTDVPNPPEFTWVVFSSDSRREAEAMRSAEIFLRRAPRSRIVIKKFRDGFLPYEGSLVKEAFEELKGTVAPDLVKAVETGTRNRRRGLIAEIAVTVVMGGGVLAWAYASVFFLTMAVSLDLS